METIKKYEDFAMPEEAPTVRTGFVVVRIKPAVKEDGRYGLRVTKKTFKRANKRNYAKRLLRAMLREHMDKIMPGFDYVFYGRTNILEIPYAEMSYEFGKALKKIGKLCP